MKFVIKSQIREVVLPPNIPMSGPIIVDESGRTVAPKRTINEAGTIVLQSATEGGEPSGYILPDTESGDSANYSSEQNAVVDIDDTPPKKKRVLQFRPKKFRPEWMEYDMFKHWLRPHPNPERAMCTVCDIVLNAGKSELEKHAAAKKHQRKMLECRHLSDLSFSENNESGAVLIDGQDIDEPIGATSSYNKHEEFFIMNEEQPMRTNTVSDQEAVGVQRNSQSTIQKLPVYPIPQGIITPKNKGPTQRKQQKYRKAWEYFPEFEQWLESDENNVYKARCKMCCKVMVADLSVLKLHAIAKKHIKICEDFDKAKAALESLSPVQSGRANLPTSRKTIKVRTPKPLLQDNPSDISVESLSLTDSIDASTFNLDSTYSEQGGEVAGTSSQASNTARKLAASEIPTMIAKAMVTKPAPPWKATAIVNGHVTRLELNDYKGRYVILFFYPQDFSAVCPTEILSLSDHISEFRTLQTEVVACSVDSHLTHLAWARTPRSEGGLANPKIPLLADPTHSIARDYGVLLPDLGHTLRAHFIIDRRGILRHMAVNDINVGRSIEELLRLIQALQHVDETESGCPADWKPGQPTV